MLRYSSESLESNLWCLFNSNFNTGNDRGVTARTTLQKWFPYSFVVFCHHRKDHITGWKKMFVKWWDCRQSKVVIFLNHPLFLVLSLYWMSQTPTVQPTAKQPSCTRKTNGSTRRECPLLWNRAGVTVDPRCWCCCCSCSEYEQCPNHLPRSRKRLISQKKTHLKTL